MDLTKTLQEMHNVYTSNPTRAVRSQNFINVLHRELTKDIDALLSDDARQSGIRVVNEANIYGSHKAKKVDVSVVHPENGPLIMIGIRSQMSSVAKNALNYYEGIVGECISLQDRFPMAVMGYIYLMPLKPTKKDRVSEVIDHRRYARMYDTITGRTGQLYRDVRGIFDQFAYMVVDFNQTPPSVRGDLLDKAEHDLHIATFVDRVIQTFESRHLFFDVFK